ncbi:MAG: hypothetical protein HYT85_18595 [candidate division NC10 bacterium]|nr:hypothetical protein [candidate division NC10 bacterium]
MKKLSSILVAGLVALAFAGDALAQTQTSPPVLSPAPGVSAEKPAAKPGKRKAKRVRKHRKTARAPKAKTTKTQ